MVLMERKLEGQDITISIELVNPVELKVSAVTSGGFNLWSRNTMIGEDAIEMYWHPYAFGLEDYSANVGASEAVEVS
jgi:hypothetical protein